MTESKVNQPLTDAEALVAQRLIDSEEHAGEGAVPPIAFEASELIKKLCTELISTRAALDQATKQSKESEDFVRQIAEMQIWSYDKNDGSPYNECDEPANVFLDSHTALMDSIEQARTLFPI
jgi:hypothetical protein